MSGKHGNGAGDEPSGGSIPTDPELEAALREAAAAVGADPDKPEDEDSLLGEVLEDGTAGASGAELRAELGECQDRLLRLQADFENFRRRALKQRQEAIQYGHQNLVKDLLSVVDNLDRAIGHAQESSGGDLGSFLQGVELVQRELLGVLEKHHVTGIEAHGKPFDPSLHEAMAQVESPGAAPNSVVDVLEKGYQLRDRLVRPSRVVVAKADDDSNKGGGASDG